MIGEWQSLQVFIGSLLIFHSLVPAIDSQSPLGLPDLSFIDSHRDRWNALPDDERLDYLIFHSSIRTGGQYSVALLQLGLPDLSFTRYRLSAVVCRCLLS